MPLKKLPGHPRAASGMEWTIFKKLPGIFLGGLALIGLITWGFHQWPPEGNEFEVAKHLLNIDIFAIGLAVVHATAVGTIAIGCVVVMIMKGPAYVADGIPMVDAESPEEADEALRKAAEAEQGHASLRVGSGDGNPAGVDGVSRDANSAKE